MCCRKPGLMSIAYDYTIARVLWCHWWQIRCVPLSNTKTPLWRRRKIREHITTVRILNSINIILCYQSREPNLFFLDKLFSIWKLQPTVEVSLANILTSENSRHNTVYVLAAHTNIDVGLDLLIIPLLTFRQVSLWSHIYVRVEKYVVYEIIVFTESENAQVWVCVPNIHNRLESSWLSLEYTSSQSHNTNSLLVLHIWNANTLCNLWGTPFELWDLFPLYKADSRIANIYWRLNTNQNPCLICAYWGYIRKLSVVRYSFFSACFMPQRERTLCRKLFSPFLRLPRNSGQKILYFALTKERVYIFIYSVKKHFFISFKTISFY